MSSHAARLGSGATWQIHERRAGTRWHRAQLRDHKRVDRVIRTRKDPSLYPARNCIELLVSDKQHAAMLSLKKPKLLVLQAAPERQKHSERTAASVNECRHCRMQLADGKCLSNIERRLEATLDTNQKEYSAMATRQMRGDSVPSAKTAELS